MDSLLQEMRRCRDGVCPVWNIFRNSAIGHALRDQLSWTHWRNILTVSNEDARNYYIAECVT